MTSTQRLADGDLTLHAGWMDPAAATALQHALRHDLGWRVDRLRLFGRYTPIPREHAWIGDPGATYTWSGLTHTPAPWPPSLLPTRARAAQTADAPFNCALANRYRDGRDRMGWHADDEPELGPVVASLSLGAERDLLLRRRDGTGRLTVRLPHGSLLVMGAGCQQRWQHTLPPRARVHEERINLTFRVRLP